MFKLLVTIGNCVRSKISTSLKGEKSQYNYRQGRGKNKKAQKNSANFKHNQNIFKTRQELHLKKKKLKTKQQLPNVTRDTPN